jgi:hypothetical protein
MNYLTFICFIGIILSAGCKSKNSCNVVHGQDNAIWVQSKYLRGYEPTTHKLLSEDDVKDFCNTMTVNGIKDVFLFAGPFDNTGHLPDYPFSSIAVQTVSWIRRYAPQLRILPWVGGIQNKNIFLNNPEWMTNALKDTKRLVDTLKSDGVHVDFEFILNTDPYLSNIVRTALPGDDTLYGKNVVEFHRRLREIIPGYFISSVIIDSLNETHSWKRKTPLKEQYQLAPYVDQICYLFYDTDIHDQIQFQRSSDQLIFDFTNIKKKYKNVKLLPAIGTFINEPEIRHYHDQIIESIPSTLKTIDKSLLKFAPKDSIVNGISIYCDWETDASEWELFFNHWVTCP